MYKSTKQHFNYWKKRKIDWTKDYFNTFNHPHRDLIIDKLKRYRFGSILEIGCASGPNLYRIRQAFPWVQYGGIDANEEAIETAKKYLGSDSNCLVLVQSSANDIFLSDKSTDILLTDMCLIYIDPFKINKVIKEIKRVTRNHIVFVEFHHPSFWKRFMLSLKSGYHAYDYKKLLENHGFYDIEIIKIPENKWPGGNPQKTFGYIITASL